MNGFPRMGISRQARPNCIPTGSISSFQRGGTDIAGRTTTVNTAVCGASFRHTRATTQDAGNSFSTCKSYSPRSACRCSHLGIWALLQATQLGGAKRPYAGISPSKPCVAGVYLACRKTGRSSRLLADIPYGSARSGEIAGRFGDRGALNGSRLWPSIDMACSRICSSCSFVRRPSPGRGSAAAG